MLKQPLLPSPIPYQGICYPPLDSFRYTIPVAANFSSHPSVLIQRPPIVINQQEPNLVTISPVLSNTKQYVHNMAPIQPANSDVEMNNLILSPVHNLPQMLPPHKQNMTGICQFSSLPQDLALSSDKSASNRNMPINSVILQNSVSPTLHTNETCLYRIPDFIQHNQLKTCIANVSLYNTTYTVDVGIKPHPVSAVNNLNNAQTELKTLQSVTSKDALPFRRSYSESDTYEKLKKSDDIVPNSIVTVAAVSAAKTHSIHRTQNVSDYHVKSMNRVIGAPYNHNVQGPVTHEPIGLYPNTCNFPYHTNFSSLNLQTAQSQSNSILQPIKMLGTTYQNAVCTTMSKYISSEGSLSSGKHVMPAAINGIQRSILIPELINSKYTL